MKQQPLPWILNTTARFWGSLNGQVNHRKEAIGGIGEERSENCLCLSSHGPFIFLPVFLCKAEENLEFSLFICMQSTVWANLGKLVRNDRKLKKKKAGNGGDKESKGAQNWLQEFIYGPKLGFRGQSHRKSNSSASEDGLLA